MLNAFKFISRYMEKDFLDDFLSELENDSPKKNKKETSNYLEEEDEKELEDNSPKYEEDKNNDRLIQKSSMDDLFSDFWEDKEEEKEVEDDTDEEENKENKSLYDEEDENQDNSDKEEDWEDNTNKEDDEDDFWGDIGSKDDVEDDSFDSDDTENNYDEDGEDDEDFDFDDNEDDWEEEDDEKEKQIEEEKLQKEIEEEEKWLKNGSLDKERNELRKLTEWYITEQEERYQHWAINKVWIRPNQWFKPNKYYTVETETNKKVLMRWENNRAYFALNKLFNLLSKDNVSVFSKKLVESDTYKNVRLEHFKNNRIKLWKFDYSCYIDCTNLPLKDPKEIQTDEAAELLVDVLYSEEELKDSKWNQITIKSNFFWKWKFYVLLNKTLPDSHYYKIVTELIDKGDYENVLLGYDILNNKLIFEKYQNLIHYQMIGASKSGKTVTMTWILWQYLAKNNTEILVIEKGNDFNLIFTKAKKVLYKSTVDELSLDDLISFFSFLSINFSLRRKILWTIPNLEDYNQLREREGKSKLWYMLIVIDEFFVLRENLKAAKVEEFFLSQLSNVVSKARSYGIYVMLATQSPNTDGIPSNLQNNLQVKFTGKTQQAQNIRYFKNDADARPIAAKNAIYLWDFILSADCADESILRAYYDVNNSIDKLIENNYILWKSKEEQWEIEIAWWPWKYSVDYLNKRNIELIALTWCQLINTDRFMKYGINLDKIERIEGITKISVIVLINFIIDWLEKTASTLKETNITPVPFNIDNVIDIANKKKENAALSFVFILIKQLYANHLNDWIKTIKFSKSDMKGLNDEWGTEALETYLANIFETSFHYINEMLDSMS